MASRIALTRLASPNGDRVTVGAEGMIYNRSRHMKYVESAVIAHQVHLGNRLCVAVGMIQGNLRLFWPDEYEVECYLHDTERGYVATMTSATANEKYAVAAYENGCIQVWERGSPYPILFETYQDVTVRHIAFVGDKLVCNVQFPGEGYLRIGVISLTFTEVDAIDTGMWFIPDDPEILMGLSEMQYLGDPHGVAFLHWCPVPSLNMIIGVCTDKYIHFLKLGGNSHWTHTDVSLGDIRTICYYEGIIHTTHVCSDTHTSKRGSLKDLHRIDGRRWTISENGHTLINRCDE